MTREQYDRSIATGEVQLSGFWEKSTHFGLRFFLFFVAGAGLFMLLLLYFQGSAPASLAPAFWVVFFPLILGFLVFRFQKNRLKFTVVQTTLKRDQLKEIIEQVAVYLEWKCQFNSDKVYEAKTDPGFFSGSWGEKITILLPDNQVFISSICDPKKRGSMVSMGRNRENEQTLVDRIIAAERAPVSS